HPGTFKGSFSQESVDKERAAMRKYLADAPAAELNKPARTGTALGQWNGADFMFPRGDRDSGELLMTNHQYYRKSESPFFPQLIVIVWDSRDAGAGAIVSRRFLDHLPIEPLRAMLDK